MTTIHPKCPRCTTQIATDSEDAVEYFRQRLYIEIDCPKCGVSIQMRHPDREDFISSLRGEPPLSVTQEVGVNVPKTGEPDDGDEN